MKLSCLIGRLAGFPPKQECVSVAVQSCRVKQAACIPQCGSYYYHYYISLSVCSQKAKTQLYTRLRTPGPMSLFRLFVFSASNVVRPSSFVSRFSFALPVFKVLV